jgi:cytochrome c oxidase subunit 2
MKFLSLFGTLLVFSFSSALSAEESEPQSIYDTNCSACHGLQAEGNPALFAPRLAGQTKNYIVEQLRQFSEGRRGAHPDDANGALMRGVSQSLTDGQIESLAVLLSGKRSEFVAEELSGNFEAGKELYQSTCLSCHGVAAEGVDHLGTANLSVLSYWYTRQQIVKFSQGWRGEDVDGNIRAAWMRAIANHISEDQIQDVSIYVESLRGSAPK